MLLDDTSIFNEVYADSERQNSRRHLTQKIEEDFFAPSNDTPHNEFIVNDTLRARLKSQQPKDDS
jgi:hypothetical protein